LLELLGKKHLHLKSAFMQVKSENQNLETSRQIILRTIMASAIKINVPNSCLPYPFLWNRQLYYGNAFDTPVVAGLKGSRMQFVLFCRTSRPKIRKNSISADYKNQVENMGVTLRLMSTGCVAIFLLCGTAPSIVEAQTIHPILQLLQLIYAARRPTPPYRPPVTSWTENPSGSVTTPPPPVPTGSGHCAIRGTVFNSLNNPSSWSLTNDTRVKDPTGLSAGHLRTVDNPDPAMGEAVADYCVRKHNCLRSFSTPSASDMLKMQWNAEVAQQAQKWADNCVYKHNSVEERTTSRSYSNILYRGLNILHPLFSLIHFIPLFYLACALPSVFRKIQVPLMA
jgi:hypothetical protein